MQAPRGLMDVRGIFRAMKDIGFDGHCLVEYERDYRDNAMGLAESFGYYRGVAAGL